MVNEKMKNIAVGGSAIVLAMAMGLQSFVFGKSDIQTLKDEITKLSMDSSSGQYNGLKKD
jgi:hypothetical protein